MAEHGSKDVEMGTRNLGGKGEAVSEKPDFDGEMAEGKGKASHRRRRNRACARCCAVTCCLLVTLVIILVILAFTVFKARDPTIKIKNVSLQDFDANFKLNLPPEISINLTLGLDISVKNPNKVSFRYSNSTTNLIYHGEVVGTVPIPQGVIRADKTEDFSTSLILQADRLITNSQLVPDLVSGSLPFSTTTELSGRVSVLGFIKRHVDVHNQCDISVSLKGSLDKKCRSDYDT